jgi:hypothetical protein
LATSRRKSFRNITWHSRVIQVATTRLLFLKWTVIRKSIFFFFYEWSSTRKTCLSVMYFFLIYVFFLITPCYQLRTLSMNVINHQQQKSKMLNVFSSGTYMYPKLINLTRCLNCFLIMLPIWILNFFSCFLGQCEQWHGMVSILLIKIIIFLYFRSTWTMTWNGKYFID